jgi:hypothetical protein
MSRLSILTRSCVALAVVLSSGALMAAEAETKASRASIKEAQAEVGELAKALRTEQRDYRRAVRQENLVAKVTDPTPEYLSRARAKAVEYAGTDAAVPFLAWIVITTGDKDEARSVAADAVAQYADSAALPPLVAAIFRRARDLGTDQTRSYLGRIMDENKHPEVQSEALYARAMLYFARRPVIGNASKAELDGARADLRKSLDLARSAGKDLVGREPVGPPGNLARRVDGVLFEAENLQIGHVAPDIVAKDLDGVEFRLSDYRGKVVMLDFWGHW